jgi:hypothetical protein
MQSAKGKNRRGSAEDQAAPTFEFGLLHFAF